jgi:hypothetical protein
VSRFCEFTKVAAELEITGEGIWGCEKVTESPSGEEDENVQHEVCVLISGGY